MVHVNFTDWSAPQVLRSREVLCLRIRLWAVSFVCLFGGLIGFQSKSLGFRVQA